MRVYIPDTGYRGVRRVWQENVPHLDGGMIYASDGSLWVHSGLDNTYNIFWPFGYWGGPEWD